MKKPITWIIIFSLIFLGAQDFPFWEHTVTFGWLGLPGWLYWFVFLQLLLVLAIWGFAKYYWKEEE